MANATEIVKKLNTAWENKDESALRLLLHPDDLAVKSLTHSIN